MKKYFLWIFLLTSVAELTSQIFDLATVHLISKPLLLISLLVYYVYAAKQDALSKTVVFSLAFFWLGDVLLMFEAEGELYFILGLLAFLVAYLFYMFAYKQHRYEDDTKALIGVQRFRFSFPIVLAGTGLITVLYSHLGNLKIPVIVYALVLVIMVLNALFRFGRTSAKSFSLVFLGAILFMISDSLIAITKYLQPIAYSGFWIMLSYLAAQYLIVIGLVKHRSVNS
jgi:uncharacterized membrane protein YhhN